jgi:pyridoxamine 5'-phosphate oxidase
MTHGAGGLQSLRILHHPWWRVTRPGAASSPSYIDRVPSPERPSLAELREEYAMSGLDESRADPDPAEMLRRWLYDAVDAGLYDPTAMVLSTIDPDGAPSSRMVLCKGVDEGGLVFYTNYDSRKGRALAHEPRVALLFPWHPLQRQVRVEGVAAQVGATESDAYFASRPRASQLGAVASPQSTPIGSRAELDQRYAAVVGEHAKGDVPRPAHWGGYRVRPTSYEFWQGRTGRLHDRLRYEPGSDGWTITRLAP